MKRFAKMGSSAARHGERVNDNQDTKNANGNERNLRPMPHEEQAKGLRSFFSFGTTKAALSAV